MNTRSKRSVCILLVSLLSTSLLAGCGNDQGTDDGGANDQSLRVQEERARQVADAWQTSAAADAWAQGYYPMADAVQAPASGWRSKADKRAFETKNFVLTGDLPSMASTRGEVEWGDGQDLTRPLISSEKAYKSFALNRSAGPHLTVTEARLGTTVIVTSRGKATVPAWVFTLESYDTPLKRVAVTPSKLPKPPIGHARQEATGGLRSITRLAGTAADGRSVTVKATHGTCDDGPTVKALETKESVVLYASIKGAESGACAAVMIEQDMRVKLSQPLGDRILLDALTGRPLPFGDPDGTAPSWT
ncbi:hypothetical protein [Streptomyces olivaceus]|uniref:hypothetical protein n=1 Tax=Streptomyces olivaceus TaxID=47716 RepID=UPI0024933D45|nr:hypothetical protein [Streptomyces olivaceus]